MFVLAHLSDPHLGPIPTPRLIELINKRGLGLINWYRKRHRHHRADVLDAIVRDMHAQSPDHTAVTGDLVNVSLEAEFAAAARWLAQVGTPERVTLVPGNHDAYIRRMAGSAAQHWRDYMRGGSRHAADVGVMVAGHERHLLGRADLREPARRGREFGLQRDIDEVARDRGVIG